MAKSHGHEKTTSEQRTSVLLKETERNKKFYEQEKAQLTKEITTLKQRITTADERIQEMSRKNNNQAKRIKELETLSASKPNEPQKHTPPSKPVVVSGSADRTIRLWTNSEVKAMAGHGHTVRSIAASHKERLVAPDHYRKEFIVSGSSDSTLRVWNLSSGRVTQVLKGHTSEVYSVAISNSDGFVVSGGLDNTIRV